MFADLSAHKCFLSILFYILVSAIFIFLQLCYTHTLLYKKSVKRHYVHYNYNKIVQHPLFNVIYNMLGLTKNQNDIEVLS
jgi:hypothetical protein